MKQGAISMFKKYVRSNIAEMRPYVMGESLAGISVSAPDSDFINQMNEVKEFNGPIGFIARNPDNHEDQWYINPDYAAKNFKSSPSDHKERVIAEVEDLQMKSDKLLEFFKADTSKGLSYAEQRFMVDQHKIMAEYIDVLKCRISLFK